MGKTIKPRDLTDVLRGAPGGEWVALTSDKQSMVAHDESLEVVVKKAKEAGVESPFLLRMPMPNVGIAASNL